MSGNTRKPTTSASEGGNQPRASRRPDPLGEEFATAIAGLRQIAADTGDHLLLGDGPAHPGTQLLDLCADALHHLTAARKAYDSRTWHDRRRDDELMAEFYKHQGLAQGAMSKAKKLRAVTAAGIYAKALCVRAFREGAAGFAMTLAEDLVNIRALRASLWGADPEPAPAPAANVVALASRARATEARV